MEDHKTKIGIAAAATMAFQEELKSILDTPETASILLTASADVTRILNKLNHLSGKAAVASEAVEFPPITNFMGDEITGPVKVTAEDLNPEEEELANLRAAVKNFQEELPSLHNKAILDGYTLPEQQLVVRGAAKNAGVEEYQEREIDEKFIEEIRAGLQEKKSNVGDFKKADELIRQVKEGQTANEVQEADYKITAEDLKNFPQLNSVGLKADDVVKIPVHQEEKVKVAGPNGRNTSFPNPLKK